MKAGVQVSLSEAENVLFETEFPYVEIVFDHKEEWESDAYAFLDERLSGGWIKLSELWEQSEQNLPQFVRFISKYQGTYLVIDTMDTVSDPTAVLLQLLSSCREELQRCGISVLIENSCQKVDEGYYCNTALSDAASLIRLVESLQKELPGLSIGVCFNTGIANLTGRNMRAILEDLGEQVKLIHVNDNDGLHDMRQLPYSFTTGRGQKSTDWMRFVGELIRQSYEGYLVFDTSGLFARAPLPTHNAFYRLLYGIYREWDKQFHFEEILQKEQHGWILFGAGQMAGHFMRQWGEKYPPAYLTDNNAALWGTQKLGVSVIAPAQLTQEPYCSHRVMICNQYYTQIRRQLEEMGIAYDCYYDEYDI